MTLFAMMAMSDSQRYPDQVWIRYLFFIILKSDYFQMKFLYNYDLLISSTGNYIRIIRNKPFKLEKLQYLPHSCLDVGFKGTVVNITLPSLHWWWLFPPIERREPQKCNGGGGTLEHILNDEVWLSDYNE